MTEQHSIAPTPELFAKCYEQADRQLQSGFSIKFAMSHAIRTAYAAGADQELKACCELLRSTGHFLAARDLSDSRRAKLLSLKEQALEQLRALDQHGALDCYTDTIRQLIIQSLTPLDPR